MTQSCFHNGYGLHFKDTNIFVDIQFIYLYTVIELVLEKYRTGSIKRAEENSMYLVDDGVTVNQEKS